MEITWKKILGVCLFFIGLIVLPIVLVSNPMMNFYQSRIDRNPNSRFSRWLQLTTANICYRTGRPERAAQSYYKFLDRYREDERRPRVLLRYGFSLDDANRNAEAIEVYIQVQSEYPDTEEAKEALAGVNRIRYLKPK